MKKILLVAAMVVASMSASAQWFAGGMAGFGTTTVKTGDVKATLTTFGINPEVGYSVNDRFDVGVAGGFISSKVKDTDLKGTGWEVGAFAQWAAIQFSDFEIQLRGDLSFGGSDFDFDEDGIPTPAGIKTTTIGFNVAPVIAYNISDRFQIRAALNCASLGINHSKTGDVKTTSFGLEADTNNLLNTNNFQLGFVVNF